MTRLRSVALITLHLNKKVAWLCFLANVVRSFIMEKYINSANVEKISWSNDTLRVYINNGQVVAYKNIPEGIAAGMAQAPSVGSYMRLYVVGKYAYEVEKQSEMKERNNKLMHHKDTTVGLYATDRPDLIPDEIKSLFFEITYDEREVVR